MTWSKDGEDIDLANPQFSTAMNAGVCSLEVALCTRQNAGVYACVAANKLGEDQTQCKVVVEGKCRDGKLGKTMYFSKKKKRRVK